jgi:hypothetical protein
MPNEVISKRWQSRQPGQDIHDAILIQAKELRVSGKAFFWRLVNASLLNKSEQESVDPDNLARPDEEDPSGRPNVFNADFVRRLHAVLQRGLLSSRKASELLECDPEDLGAICAAYGHPSPVRAPTPATNAAAAC